MPFFELLRKDRKADQSKIVLSSFKSQFFFLKKNVRSWHKWKQGSSIASRLSLAKNAQRSTMEQSAT